MDNRKIDIQKFALTSIFAAIIFLLTFVTPIGFIPLGFINATIVHVPVIIGAVVLGPKLGAVLGALFGVASFIKNTIAPVALSFAFSPLVPVPGADHGSPAALLICFVPRILVGVVPYFIFKLFKNAAKERPKLEYVSLAVSGVLGSLTNTLLVMPLIFFVFKEAYALARNIPLDSVYAAVLTVISVNGVAEAVVAGILTAAVGKAILYYQRKRS